ncbi:3-hydroxyacyl-CoA dehydrogenase NAD-binding domain-containing protein [Psychromicrobium sp. YIM B11713]|uniref:3-hydroxyacyl-CoA dehydrogenase NAD-binding domain-containing protein n=1 Tax=Psychromicrobium sp. YIM B11713 TaxID=3145233 RepID=UPI00374F1B33
MNSDSIRRVAVVGAGTIGLSWMALFAKAGLSVTVSDPRPDVAEVVRDSMPELAKTLGSTAEELLARVTVSNSLEEAVAEADLVQENGPERLEFKQQLFVEIASAAPAHALLTSSSSGIVATLIAEKLDDAAAARMLIAHPFNPPQLMPLVEIVPGERTVESSTLSAIEFYRELGKIPVREHKEIQGFVANRLQAVVLKEAFSLVLQGVVSVEELDTAMKASLGARWATIGPFESYHLGGGPGGIRHMFAHLGGNLTDDDSGVTEADVERLITDVESTYGAGPEAYRRLAEARDRRQLAVNQAVNN